MEMTHAVGMGEGQEDRWVAWPVYWTAAWVGALAAIAVALVIGLIGIAVGAHLVGPDHRVVDWHKFGLGALIFSVLGSFLAFVVGGWAAARIAGIRRSEPAMLHGAIVWLISVPLLLVLGGLGVGNFFGGWYGGLAGTPSWTSTLELTPGPTATADELMRYNQRKDEAAKAARNAALGAVTALLLGLVGAVVGGWMASGEPMTFTYYRTRQTMQTMREPNAPSNAFSINR